MNAHLVREHLRNALVVEMEDLFSEVKVLQGRGTARANSKRVLIIGNRGTLLRCHGGYATFSFLMSFAAQTSRKLLIEELRFLA